MFRPTEDHIVKLQTGRKLQAVASHYEVEKLSVLCRFTETTGGLFRHLLCLLG